MSTADALAGALGGRLYVNSSEFEGSKLYRTEVKFKIKLTNERFAGSYADDLLVTRK